MGQHLGLGALLFYELSWIIMLLRENVKGENFLAGSLFVS